MAKDEEGYEDALGEVVPDILKALSMGLPCREMCDTVTQTCGCGDPETFGEVSLSVIFCPTLSSQQKGLALVLMRGVWVGEAMDF